jgi:molecular chaperone GrpE
MTDVAANEEQQRPPEGNKNTDHDLLDLLQRERADFLNFRRRAALERTQEGDRARLDLLQRLLPLLDDLDLALSQTPAEFANHPWTKGLLLSRRRLLDFFSRTGLEPFGAVGEEFDPALHETVFYDARPEFVISRVERVIRPGYRMAGRVIRPAQVGVVGPIDDQTAGAPNKLDITTPMETDPEQATGGR